MNERIHNLSEKLNNKIISLCKTNEFEKYRSFYGEVFALSSLEKAKKLDLETEEYLSDLFKDKDRVGEDFHYEFNNYALITSPCLKEKFKESLFPLKFRGTECTSWTLLRERVLFEEDSNRDLFEVLHKIENRQEDSGLILDEPWDKSFQYHCFSMAMIGEIFEITKDKKLLESFSKGIDFITPFISPTGETTFVGRGQSQSFGYSSLLYILVLGEKLLSRDLSQYINLILSLIENQFKKFEDLPLVINHNILNPYLVDISDPIYCGWYPYNNHIDYFCFSSYFITKASLINVQARSNLQKKEPILKSSDFLIQNSKYYSIVSNVGGYWVNDLPIPYVQYKGESVLPLYGGDQFHSKIFQFGEVPLPINKLVNLSIRKRCNAKIIKNCLIVKSFLGNFKRSFNFKENSIYITNQFLLPFFYKTPYFFLKGTCLKNDHTLTYKSVEFVFSKPLKSCENSFSVTGELLKYEIEGNHSMEINFL